MEALLTSPQPMLCLDGEVYPVDLAELDADVRAGLVPGHAELWWPPWTSTHPEGRERLDALEPLAAAFEAPAARLAARAAARPLPWITYALVLFLAVSGGVEVAVTAGGWTHPSAVRWADWLGTAATGFEAIVLDGRWWSPLTSQLPHKGLLHLLPNLVVVAYAGQRLERLFGGWVLSAVGLASVAGGAMAVAALERLPVVGASLLGFGLLAGVIVIGFRVGEDIPRRLRRRYGFGNLPLFLPLGLIGLVADGTSHLGHLGAVLAGGFTALLVPLPTVVPRMQANLARVGAGLVAAVSVLLPSSLARLTWAWDLALGAAQPVEATGWEGTMPAKLAAGRTDLGELAVWRVGESDGAWTFAGVATRERGGAETAEVVDGWEALLHAEIDLLDHYQGPEEEVWRLTVHTDPPLTLVEHRRGQGAWRWRRGWAVPPSAEGREDLFEDLLVDLAPADPPLLAEVRARHAMWPDAGARQVELAWALVQAGDFGEAEALLAPHAEGAWTSLRRDAILQRLRLCAWSPGSLSDPHWPDRVRGADRELRAARADCRTAMREAE